MRKFETGATRDNDEGKNDYEGFFSPLVVEAFGDYMNKHRVQADGDLRDSDNWQKGIPKDAYMKSSWRHFIDLWKEHRGLPSRDGILEALMALIFNLQGYAHEYLKERLAAEANEPTVRKPKRACDHIRSGLSDCVTMTCGTDECKSYIGFCEKQEAAAKAEAAHIPTLADTIECQSNPGLVCMRDDRGCAGCFFRDHDGMGHKIISTRHSECNGCPSFPVVCPTCRYDRGK